MSSQPLRLSPGLAIAAFVAAMGYVLPAVAAVAPDAEMGAVPIPVIGIGAAMLGTLALAIWWLFFSRAAWVDRVGVLMLAVLALGGARLLVHESIAGAHMGWMLWIYAIPPLGIAMVAGAAAGRWLTETGRRIVTACLVVAVPSVFTLMRTDGITGDGKPQLHWRWTPTQEQQLLARPHEEHPGAARPEAAASRPAIQPATGSSGVSARPPEQAPSAVVAEPEAEEPSRVAGDDPLARHALWPGFRGLHRDGVVRNLRIATDWSVSPPQELWRRPVGPGWSSFAVGGDVLYTQEQRGDEEMVAAYRLSTGEPVWRHGDPVRFWESNGGAGPRGTPSLDRGRVYAFGATGVLNALDARTGHRLWSRDVAADTGAAVPDWGFASSPLVVGGAVIVAASGQLAAYDAQTGEPRWKGPAGGAGYSSPHLVSLDGVPQIVLLRGSRTISVSPADGTLLWEHTWQPGAGIVQPAVAGDADLLITTCDAMGGLGIRRVSVAPAADGWHVDEQWTTRGLKPYFNDFVVHDGHAYGFDGSILAAIDLADGARKWKGGRYGSGQMLLLADQHLLLVLSEDGELVLVSATPDAFREVARAPGLHAKTWNHPVIAGSVLLVRNGEEMAAFRLPLQAAR